MTDFSGKRALVLGGSRGIGAAIVRRLCGDGAVVVFTYSGSETAASQLAIETGSTAKRADSADRDAVISCVQAEGALDILVVNAGIFMSGVPTELAPDDIDRMLAINVHAPYHGAVEAARRMKDGGRIILIGSANGERAGFEGVAAYAMTKSALQGLARGLARDLGGRGITVNVVQPGPIDTDLNPASGQFAEFMHGLMAIKRHGTAVEVAGLVAYLAGPEAAFTTGAMHTIDGGFTA